MSNGPKISIITACYNAENTIEQTIQSVINQTYENIEYIIIDGASTDGTMDIVEKYSGKVDVIVSEPDQGVYDAFNKGVSLATGDYINFMNADDYFINLMVLSTVTSYLSDTRSVDLLYGNVVVLDEKTKNWGYSGKEISFSDLKSGEMCPHQSVFAARHLFDKYGGFDLKYRIVSDYDFIIKTFKEYEDTIIYAPEEIAVFRNGGISSSIENSRDFYREKAMIQLENFGEIAPSTLDKLNNENSYSIASYYRSWLESLLLDNNNMARNLGKLANKKIMIFGTKKNASYIYYALKREGIEVTNFLDNDRKMQGQYLHEIKIISPQKLLNVDELSIIISVENEETIQYIKDELSLLFQKNVNFISWKELV